MTFWRMQLHPAESGKAMAHAVQSVSAGFIGLDFYEDPGDLTKVRQDAIPQGQRDYWDFANKMAKGDAVLIVVHNFPFALVTVDGDYNYIRTPDPKIGVWFRHFRAIKNPRYYADRVTNAHNWEDLTMTDAISILNDSESKSYKLIKSW